MSLTIKRVGAAIHMLHGADTLSEEVKVQLFTAGELSELQRERRDWLVLQMPSFIRGEEEDAVTMFELSPEQSLS